ncbi:hypothetical protein [Gordonia sp. VNK21]|uniref:restriction endonuclease subunit S n=1 Tax=Gordonia sp. VNK21 TaxID=3382483 RepID=UPI0038D3E851
MNDVDYPPLSVTKLGIVPQLDHVAKTDNNDNRKLVRCGDFVINSRSDRKGSSGVSEHDGSVSVINIVLEPRDTIDVRFAHHLLRSEAFQEEYYRWGNGIVADLWSTRYSAMKRIPVALPALAQQRAIADFLDRETARIDTLIEEQQRLIGLLRERRQDTVATALHGLPGRTKLKYCAMVQTGVTLNGEGDPSWPEWPYLRVANVQVGRVDLAEVKTIRLRPEDAAMSMLRAGDVLMTEGGDIDKLGRGALWSGEISDALHQNHVFAVRPNANLLPEFLVYTLDGAEARTYFFTTAKQTTNLASTNKWTLGNLPLSCPPVDEQRRIVAYLDKQTTRIDMLIAETEEFIDLSRERRSALITAAVTGQIDVQDVEVA